VRAFPHNDLHALTRELQQLPPSDKKVIVCDGVYADDGWPAPLRQMAEIARSYNAAIYVDDAHALGLLGAAPTLVMPYGFGGAGTPAHAGAPPGAIAHVGSLSKAFGVPVAFASGPHALVARLRHTAQSQIHASPPAIPMVASALAALQLNALSGNALRRRLLSRVRHFRRGVAALPLLEVDRGPRVTGNPDFPIQTLRFATGPAAAAFAARVRRTGIWPVLQISSRDEPFASTVRFVVTARHTLASIDAALKAISAALSTW
jgi:7-keto-8-aminopelargonate synthetase-like enzyme